MAEAVVPEAQALVARLRLDSLAQVRAERAVERAVGVGGILEGEGQVDDFEFGHPVGEIARREIAHAEHSAFHHGEEVGRAVAEVHHVPENVYFDFLPQPLAHLLPEENHRAAVGGIGRGIAPDADVDGPCHLESLLVKD